MNTTIVTGEPGDRKRSRRVREGGVGEGPARAPRRRRTSATLPSRRDRAAMDTERVREAIAHGERAPALRRPPTTGRAPTHAGAAAKRSNDYSPREWPALSTVIDLYGSWAAALADAFGGAWTSGRNAAEIRTRACARRSVNGSAERRRERFFIRPNQHKISVQRGCCPHRRKDAAHLRVAKVGAFVELTFELYAADPIAANPRVGA